jgi:hypothetical protein
MIIKFKLYDYDDICDEYEEVFEQEDVVDVVEGEDCLVVRTRRIVIPALHASFREAEWLVRNPDVDEDDEDAWETQCSVIVHYEETEQDPEKFISYASCDIEYFAKELADAQGLTNCDIGELECYIDTAEFIE